MKSRHFFQSLKVQIVAYYAVTSLIIVLLISSVYLYSTSNLILDDTLDQTIYAVEQSGSDIELYLNDLKHITGFLSANETLQSYLTGGDESSKAEGHRIINQVLETEHSIVSIVLVGKSGRVLSNEKELEMSISEDMMSESWYVNAIDNQEMPALTSARLQEFTMDKDTWVIAISQEILDVNGNNIGVVLLDFKYDVIENYLDHLPLGNLGYTFIMDEMEHVVYHKDPIYFTDKEKIIELISMANMKNGYDEENKLLTHLYEIPNTHWTLVGVASLDRLDTVNRQLVEVLIVFSVIMLIVLIIGGLLIASRITNPIGELINIMGEVSNLKGKANEEGSSYEVNQLAIAFNKMVLEIEHLLEEIQENERYIRNYELNALYSQINPHFLYNTLDTIVWMAEFNDSEKVISVTKSLAQFFRISLSKGRDMISLEDEFDHIKQYLYIQKQRYLEQLSYNLDLTDEIKEIKVPKIILQPLVENAIYHGIREKESGGTVSVTGKLVDDVIILTVFDDGVGFDNTSKKTKLGGVGIENVKKRLQLVYDNKCTFDIKSKPNEGTSITISIQQDGE